MDDIERLRRAHADIPAPGPETVEPARRRLNQAIVGTVSPSPQPTGLRRGARRRWRVSATAAAAAIAVGLVALWPGDSSSPAGPSTALAARACVQSGPGPASPCLDALGKVAAAGDVLDSGDVFYRRDLWSQSTAYIGPDGKPQLRPRGEGVYAIVRAGFEELWVAPDRSGRIEFGAPQRPYLPSTADRRAWRAAGSPDLERLAPPTDPRDTLPARKFSPGELDAVLLGAGGLNEALPDRDPLAGLPHQPAALARELRRIAWVQRVRISGEGPCAADLHDCSTATKRNIKSVYGSDITLLLRYPFAAPGLRRALLQVLGDVPGARRLGAMQDPLGRRGVGILLPDPVNDGLNVVLFDLSTARLLAEGRADDGTQATLRWQNIFDLEVAGVDDIGKRP